MFAVGTLLLLVTSPPVRALGIRIADQNPVATARGNAFVATADNPSAIYYNPAGIAQLEGHHFDAGVYAITFQSEFRAPNDRVTRSKAELQPVPQLYYVFAPPAGRWAAGLGVYSPYGLSLEWPRSSGFRTLATEGEINYVTVNPVVAWEINPQLSVAAGLTANYAKADLARGVGVFGPRDEFRFEGDDTDVGFNAGALWKVHPQHVLGLNYRSATTQEFSGHSEIKNPNLGSSRASARFHFPQHVSAGWSFRPTPKWNLEFNADWTDWDSLDTVRLRQKGGADIPLSFNWQSSWFYEWGVTRYFSSGWHLSGGYIFSENSVPDQSFNPIVPDSDRHIFSVGTGGKYRRWDWDLAYQMAYGPTRTVSGSPLSFPAGESADGRYEFISHAFTFSIGFTF
jgi:long-chain fatty acid transport protein